MSLFCSKVEAAVVSWKVSEKNTKLAKTKMFNLQPDRIVLTRQTICNKKSESKCDPNSSQETAFDCNGACHSFYHCNINVNPKNDPTELISLSAIWYFFLQFFSCLTCKRGRFQWWSKSKIITRWLRSNAMQWMSPSCVVIW